MTSLTIPAGLEFAELGLELEQGTGRLMFAPSPLGRLCLRNGRDPEVVLASADLSCALIVEWYLRHRELQGAHDSVFERVTHMVASGTYPGMCNRA